MSHWQVKQKRMCSGSQVFALDERGAHAGTGDQVAETERDEGRVERAEGAGAEQAREPDVRAHAQREPRKRAEVIPVQGLAGGAGERGVRRAHA